MVYQDNLKQIATKFWSLFSQYDDMMYNYLMSDDFSTRINAYKIINPILEYLKIDNQIGIKFSRGIHNGMKLKERADWIKVTLSPLFDKKNKTLLDEIYNIYVKNNKKIKNQKSKQNLKLQNKWFIVKYTYHNPLNIHNISLVYDELFIVDKSHFSYHPIIDEKSSELSIILFIDDNVSKKLIDQKTQKPVNNFIHKILNAAIGEYNLINILSKVEIRLKSDLEKKEFQTTDVYELEHMMNNIKMMENHPLQNCNKCARCGYNSNNVKLYRCGCKKVYYCDEVCQRAHLIIHKLCNC